MIAEMSEKEDGDKKEETPAEKDSSKPASSASTADAKPTKNDSKKSSNKEALPPVKKSSASKSDTPKSSFAAWKLAKGRKNGVKSPNRKEISVGRKDLSVASPGPATNGAPKELSAPLPAKKSLEESAVAEPKNEVADKKAAAGAISQPKKSPKKDPNGAKKSLSLKKAGSSVKKDKDGLSPKKAAKKAAALAAKNGLKTGKIKSKKGDQGALKAAAFPEKIMELLQDGLASNAIYWLPEGEAIAVDPDNFKDSTVISKQFRGNKLSSFVRSLNRW